MNWRISTLILACAVSLQARAQGVSVMAAGSLKDALTEVAAQFEARSGTRVSLTFGPSGLLRQRLEQGSADASAQAVSLFISADTDHPQKLAQAGGWQAPQVVLQNRMCVLANENVKPNPDVLAMLLDPALRVGISTPKSDPAGDYAWTLFGKAQAVRAGATQILRDKALQLTGGPQSPQAPAGRNPYAWVMSQGMADVFVTYCTNANSARRDTPGLQILPVPDVLQVTAAYGMTLRSNAPAAAQQLAQALLQADAQAVFAKYGFASPDTKTSASTTQLMQLKVLGQVQDRLSLSAQDLHAMPIKTLEEQRSVTQDGRQVVRKVIYEGVLLRDLLERAQPLPDRRQIRKAVVLLTATDGYQASFSWGELFNSNLGDGVIVVLRQDGKDVIKADGWPTVRSLHDKRSGPRHVRWLQQLELLLPVGSV